MRKLLDLVPKMLDATEEGRLKWEPRTSNMFGCVLKDLTVQLWVFTDEESDTSGVGLSLSNPKRPFENMDTAIARDFESDYGLLFKLFSAARRSALNIDAVINDLDSELNNLLSD
jgi:hypothetical protein